MKRKLAIGWAGAWMALVCISVSATGQDGPATKMGRTESLQAGGWELPDSAIVYSPFGNRAYKHVYLPGKEYGEYRWAKEAWSRMSSEPDMELVFSAVYDRDVVNVQSKAVSYTVSDGTLWFHLPLINKGEWAFPVRSDYDSFRQGYDAERNLTSIRAMYDHDRWEEMTATYNAENHPVSVEKRNSSGECTFKARYEYNGYGYATLFDSDEWNGEKKRWEDCLKITAEYDARGKLLSETRYEDGKIKGKERYTYYDETHYASRIRGNDDFEIREEWKYDADGKPESYSIYTLGALLEHVVFYPHRLSTSTAPTPAATGVRVWVSGGRLHLTAATSGTAQVYTMTGQRIKTVAFASGQTAVTPLPKGVYIVVADGVTRKVMVRE